MNCYLPIPDGAWVELKEILDAVDTNGGGAWDITELEATLEVT